MLSCAVLTTVLVGTRALPYVPTEFAAPGLLSAEIKFVAIGSHLLRPLIAPLLVVFLLVLWRGRRRWRDPDTGRRSTPPWLGVVIYTGLLIGHGAFDFDPAVAAPAWLSLPLLAWPGWTRRLAAGGQTRARVGIAAVAAALFVPWAATADTPGDVAGLLVWVGAWLLLTSRGHERLALHDRGWVAAAALAAAQLSAAFFPVLLPTHGGIQLADDMAYTWCQHPDQPRLFAAVTGCPTTPGLFVTQEACQSGHVAEIDPRTMEVVAHHQPLTSDFFGRIEQVVCLPDGRLRLGMADGVLDGVPWRDNTAELDPDDPSRLVRRVLDADIGHRLVYDARHDATVYVSEHTGKVFRVDERTGEIDRSLGRELGLGDEGGSRVTSDGALHDARDTVYLGDWMNGSSVHELNRVDGTHVRTFDTRGGGMLEVTVDEAYDRVYASQGWGMDVIDLQTGEVTHSRRTGFMTRRPAIDTVYDLVYVPSMTDGKVRVFDRETMEPVGAFRVGYGPRDAYITPDGQRLLTSSAWGMYTWNTQDLARRFGRGP
jgi:hypothetical protein